MTTTPLFDAAQFPGEIAGCDQWVCWRREIRDGKPTKVPIDARTGRMAMSNAASTWCALEEAIPYARANGLGVGFVFSERDPYAGIDLDRCIDPGTRRVLPWAWEIVAPLRSYTEVSPSGLGVKVIVRATLPPGRRGWGDGHGMYDRARFFTLTGVRIPELPATVANRQSEIEALHARLFPPAPPPPTSAAVVVACPLSDAEVVQRAMSAANGLKFSRLWLGDRGGYDSDSESDAALVSLLAFWTGPDPERLDALFRQSALARGKWDRASYRDKTIALALQRSEYYQPGRGGRSAIGPRRRKGAAFMPR